MAAMTDARTIRARIAALGVEQQRVALLAGYEASAFSRILSGVRKQPADFIERVTIVLDALDEADQAQVPDGACRHPR